MQKVNQMLLAFDKTLYDNIISAYITSSYYIIIISK